MLNRIEAEGQGGAAEERRLGFMAGTRRWGRPLPRVRVFLSRLWVFFFAYFFFYLSAICEDGGGSYNFANGPSPSREAHDQPI
jgi:hypothetical protein